MSATTVRLLIILSAILMNHYEARAFWRWHLLDGVPTFPTVALADGLRYPRIVRPVGPRRHAPSP